MKNSWVTNIIWLLLTLVAVAIAIPRFEINFQDRKFVVRNLAPTDFSSEFVVPDFAFKQSLDLSANKEIIYSVDIKDLAPEEIPLVLNSMRDVLETRLQIMGITDYEISARAHLGNAEYYIILRIADILPEKYYSAITSTGQLAIWTADSEQDPAQAGAEATAFTGRIDSGISNPDILSAQLVTDSRVYLAQQVASALADPTILPANIGKVENFGIRLNFRPEAEVKFINALISNPIGVSPLLVSIDGVPVAYQASGQFFDASSSTDMLLLFTLGEDTREENALLAALMSTPSLPYKMTIYDINLFEPRLGDSAITITQLGLLIPFVLWQIFLYFKNRKYSLPQIAVNFTLLVWGIAVLKILSIYNVTLDLSLILGFYSALVVFMLFQENLFTRMLALDRQLKIWQEEYNNSRDTFRNIAIVVMFISFFLQQYGIFATHGYATGLGFGMAAGLVVVITVLKSALAFTFAKIK